QDIYDYAHSDDDRRLAQWHVRPETEVPAWQASDWVELWVRGGEIAVNTQRAHANCFVIVEPGATVRIASGYGAIALVWAEGRERGAAREPGGARPRVARARRADAGRHDRAHLFDDEADHEHRLDDARGGRQGRARRSGRALDCGVSRRRRLPGGRARRVPD